MAEEDGTRRELVGRVCRPESARPASPGPARVAVILHGSPGERRAFATTLQPCGGSAIRWFTSRGMIGVQALRRGYGETGGRCAESVEPCTTDVYVRAGLEAARDAAAVVSFAALPGARPDGVVVVGQSAGGWATLAYDSLPHPGVAAFVSLAGGRGGHQHDRPHENCRPDHLAEAAARFGAAATTPMLWIHAANDSYFSPAIAASLHAAFTGAGGRAEYVALPPFGRDGHGLFFGQGGPDIWGPIVERYLVARRVVEQPSAKVGSADRPAPARIVKGEGRDGRG